MLERDDYVYEGDNISAIAEFNPLAVDVSDPEAPILFEPLEPDPSEAPAVEDEGEAEPELVADEEMPMADAAELPPDLDEYEPSEGNVGDVETEGELDAAIRHMTEQGLNSLCAGPDLRVRGANTEVASSFEMPFGKSRVRCVVPKRAVSETSGEVLEPSLLQQSMELELKELESFKVGEVVSEREARSEAKKCGRRVLSCRWVNTVKRPGLYRSRLVVRDFASCGGTTLSEGLYSPTTSLEGLRLLLSVLCRSGSMMSCDVSVAFMHAKIARPEFVQLPSNITRTNGDRVFLRLLRAMNGLRSAPLSWYKELSGYLASEGFSQILDPTIFRRKGKKGLLIVLFYVDDLLIWAEDSSDARRVFEDLQKRYKLKKTGELFEKQPGEVSFLGRRIFRRRKGDNRVYFGLDSKYLESCCEEYNISKSSAKLPPLERRYAELLKKVGNEELISVAAHEKYRRCLGRIAWAALSRPDLQYVVGFLGRHQAAPNCAAEQCMRDVLRWVSGLPRKVQVFPSTREILEEDFDRESVTCFTDASWGVHSTSGGVLTWDNCCIKSFSRKQVTVALSSAEAELCALTEIAKEGLYIALLVQTLLEGVPEDSEEGRYLLRAFSDSESAICVAQMTSLLRKVRHIELRAAFLQQLVARGRFTLSHIPGVTNPADALTKSPTPENLVSLYEACGLVEEPQEWSKYLEESDEPSVAFPKKVTFKEPNTNDTLCYEVEGYEDFEIPSSWREAGVKLVAGKAKFVVFELCCEAESALALACEGKRDVAYFGVTKEVNLSSRKTFSLIRKLLGVILAESSELLVFAHLSTPCTAGCGFRHVNLRKIPGLAEKWRKQLKMHKMTWKVLKDLFRQYSEHSRLLLTHEWPRGSSLWHEDVFKKASRDLKLFQGCVVDRCCFEKGEKRYFKRWWFVSNSTSWVREFSGYECSNDHEHVKQASKASGVYPKGLGNALLATAKKVLRT